MPTSTPAIEALLATLHELSLERSALLWPPKRNSNASAREQRLAWNEVEFARVKAAVLLAVRTPGCNGEIQGLVYALVTELEASSRVQLEPAQRVVVAQRYKGAIAQLKVFERRSKEPTPGTLANRPMPSSSPTRPSPLTGQGDEIEALYRGGETMSSIAARYGVRKQAVQQLLRRRNVGFSERRNGTDKRIREMATQGVTVQEIAKATELSTQTVREAHRRLGIPPTWNTPQRIRLSEETVARMFQLREEGQTLRAIAEVLGVSRSVVSKRLLQAEIRVQAQGPKTRSPV